VQYANRFAPNANQITLKHEELTVDGIKQLYMDCDSEEDKYRILVELYHILTIGSSIIFVKVILLTVIGLSLFDKADKLQRP
jgi:ATP-dependent RNA helicase DDX19/DBP5